jgi:Cu/Ag efflux pump CusA
MDRFQVITKGAIDRLNPILMTAITTGLALIPLALKGAEPGNEIQSPMAIVILGGLLTSTLLNLLVIPCIYLLITKDESNTAGYTEPLKDATSF